MADSWVCDPRVTQALVNCSREINVGASPVLARRPHEFRREAGRDIFTDFEMSGANAGPDPCPYPGGVCSGFSHRIDGPLADPGDGSSPARVGRSDDAGDLVPEQYRTAVGDRDEQGQSGLACNKGVRPSGTTSRSDGQDIGAVDLIHPCQSGFRNFDRTGQNTSTLGPGPVVVSGPRRSRKSTTRRDAAGDRTRHEARF